jgi:hypothetical protein
MGDGTTTNRTPPVWGWGLTGAKYYYFNGRRVARCQESGVLQ